jgi:hypothetical protein
VLAAVIVLTLGVGGAAYAVDTAAQTHSGLIPTSGPTTSAIGGGQGGPGGAGIVRQRHRHAAGTDDH